MILIIDDDSAVRSSLSFMLKRAGYEVKTAPGPREAMDIVRAEAPALILMDMNFTLSTTGEEGLTLLKQVKVFRPDVPVILMTAWGSIQLAVQGMQAGAFDFITKPWNNAALLQRIETALELTAAPKEVPEEQTTALNRSHIIGKSKGLMEVLNTVARIARTNASVLITGESGTGKELIAEAIHINSQRVKQPFVKVNLGGISQSLFESEMFGHKAGSFTGALKDKRGLFEEASNGTIFLDEIGEMAFELQAKLLRILETGEYIKIGDTKPTRVNVRIIAATNRNLPEEIAAGRFREDLFYRINTIHLEIPPLRERGDDILLFVETFLHRFASKYQRPEMRMHEQTIEKLRSYHWPGNIRELQHAIEKAVILCEGNVIRPKDILVKQTWKPQTTSTVPNLEEVERQAIETAILQNNGNLTAAAEQLGISRQTLYNKLKRFKP